jgi:hypothetical protein
MSQTHKKSNHKFDDEQHSGRNGKHAKHKNNHRYHGLPILNWVDDEIIFELSEVDVASDINKM